MNVGHNVLWVDYVIIIVILTSSFFSLKRGFIQEVMSLFSLGCAFFIAGHYYTYFGVYFTGLSNTFARNIISMISLFIIILIIGAIINYFIASLIRKGGLSATDKILGFFWGFGRGVIIVGIILIFLNLFTDFSKSEDWQHSKLIPEFRSVCISNWIWKYLKSTALF